MATPAKAVIRRSSRRKISSTPSSTPNTAICTSLLKQVFLHDWWLIKADPDSQGRRLGVGGFASKGNQGIRIFLSSPIVKRHDAVTLTTVDGITIMVYGHLNRSRTLESGFSNEVCDQFVIGFPYNWEEFAALSVDEAGHFSISEGIFGSGAYKTPTPRDKGSKVLSRNIFDDILQQNNVDVSHCSGGASRANKGRSPQIITMVSTPDETPLRSKKMKAEHRRGNHSVENVVRSGPLTRSKTRLLDQ
ncbi:hypothetical protein CDL12_05783 [Handroanthus impetiginosus]|uniref:SANTA domain-containing protein n=1 Tax=Handroanthus impetiginosus TaxID=429701 RepID=A0A2G9HVM2_9LAMI|nr:hypothetical protein CDL12_05783 [Handroanthus impetiginosus]